MAVTDLHSIKSCIYKAGGDEINIRLSFAAVISCQGVGLRRGSAHQHLSYYPKYVDFGVHQVTYPGFELMAIVVVIISVVLEDKYSGWNL